MTENPSSYPIKITVFCPYCGTLNTEEHLLKNLFQDKIYGLECRGCGKYSVLVLYDFSSTSEITKKMVCIDCGREVLAEDTWYEQRLSKEYGNMPQMTGPICSKCYHDSKQTIPNDTSPRSVLDKPYRSS